MTKELRIIGYLNEVGRTVTASNQGTILFEVPAGEIWEVSRMAIRCRSVVLDSRLDAYIGEVADSNLIDGSNSGDLDFADNSAPYILNGGDTLRLVWTNADNAVVATARIQGKRGKIMESRGLMPGSQLVDIMPANRRAPLRRKVTQGFGGGGW